MSAGAVVFAPSGRGGAPCGGDEPIAIVGPTRDGSFIVFSVMRKAVWSANGLPRSWTRSAAFIPYAGFDGYVYVPFGAEKESPATPAFDPRGSFWSRTPPFAPWSSYR